MRFLVLAVCAGAVAAIFGCDPIPAPSQDMGQLVFAKDASCSDTANTELFIDTVSQGQYTMRPGSTVGFNESANTHIARAVERSGKLRDFLNQAVFVPALAQGFYTMKCSARDSIPIPSPRGR